MNREEFVRSSRDEGWIWHLRSVIVKDKPDALRPYRWTIERKIGRKWKFVRQGRAFTYGGALKKAARLGVMCPWKVERTELAVVTRDVPEPPDPEPAHNPLPPELLP